MRELIQPSWCKIADAQLQSKDVTTVKSPQAMEKPGSRKE
jgi:hypothetical protein